MPTEADCLCLASLTPRCTKREQPLLAEATVSGTQVCDGGLTAILSQCVPFSPIDVGRVSLLAVVFLFFLRCPASMELQNWG